MAKKKAAAKNSKKATAPRRAVPKRLKAQSLPGMEEVSAPIPKLSNICGALADARAAINDHKATEKGLLQAALPLLQAHKRTVYKSHGVELVHVHGDDKVRARLVDDDSDGSGASTGEDDGE